MLIGSEKRFRQIPWWGTLLDALLGNGNAQPVGKVPGRAAISELRPYMVFELTRTIRVVVVSGLRSR
jgi:hypothetical protein